MITTSLVIALAAGVSAATIAKAWIFTWLRSLAMASEYLYRLVGCPLCLAYWIVFILCALYKPRLVRSTSLVLDCAVSAFGIAALAVIVAWAISRMYWRTER